MLGTSIFSLDLHEGDEDKVGNGGQVQVLQDLFVDPNDDCFIFGVWPTSDL